MTLTLQNVSVRVGDLEIINNVSINIRSGEVHAFMGPNGSGKSSLAYAIAGHPDYRVTEGKILFGDTDICVLPPEERAKLGLFLSFQEPPEVGGVSMNTFLKMIGMREEPQEILHQLNLQDLFLLRFLNEGFSGGEKKKSELLQFLARNPRLAIFDEIDSGLDVDSLGVVAKLLSERQRSGTAMLVISHSPRLFGRLKPNRVYVLNSGRIVSAGGPELLPLIEEMGYGVFSS